MQITITLTEIDFPHLNGLLSSLGADMPPASVAESKKPKKSKEIEAPAPPETAAEDSGITITDIRAEASKLAKGGKREELKAILTELGAESLGKLEPEFYAVFLEKIKTV